MPWFYCLTKGCFDWDAFRCESQKPYWCGLKPKSFNISHIKKWVGQGWLIWQHQMLKDLAFGSASPRLSSLMVLRWLPQLQASHPHSTCNPLTPIGNNVFQKPLIWLSLTCHWPELSGHAQTSTNEIMILPILLELTDVQSQKKITNLLERKEEKVMTIGNPCIMHKKSVMCLPLSPVVCSKVSTMPAAGGPRLPVLYHVTSLIADWIRD